MDTVILFIVGILLALLGLAVSIALHEVGHLLPAKLFGVRVPQYMIGFGPTLVSRRIGETEYGVKAIPLGGYVSLIGMFPPRRPGEAARGGGTGFLSTIIDDARTASADTVRPGEEHRAYYRLPVWKRIVIMAGGPAMNLVLAVVCFLIVASGFGLYQPTTTVEAIYQCVVPQSTQGQSDTEECAEPSPAAAGGLQPGDTVLAVDGQPVDDWEQLQSIIQASADRQLRLSVDRDGQTVELQITPRANTLYLTDDFTGQVLENPDGSYRTHVVGYVGFTPLNERQQQPAGYAVELAGHNIAQVANIILTMPQRVTDMWNAGFGGAERDPNGPMSVVGVGRLTGEFTAQTSIPVLDRAASIIMIVGSLNIALGIMNLIPLPPLDGGNIVAALIDGIRRGWAKLRRRPDPGWFDTAKLVPVTMVVSIAFIAMSALFIYVDLVNPVQLFE